MPGVVPHFPILERIRLRPKVRPAISPHLAAEFPTLVPRIRRSRVRGFFPLPRATEHGSRGFALLRRWDVQTFGRPNVFPPIPFFFRLFRTLFRNGAPPTAFSSIASALFPLSRGVYPPSRL